LNLGKHTSSYIGASGLFNIRLQSGKVSGVDFKTVEAERRPGDPASLVAQADKIERLTGWKPRHADLRTIVADAWRWEKKLYSRR